jgi:prepilin-type N-terminal cleavage/methylation domain-containing protein
MTLWQKNARGYTLIEMLVSVGLVALLILVIIDSALLIAKTHKKAKDYLEVNGAAVGVFSRFSRDIRRATSIDTVNSTLGASGGRIVLNMLKDDGTTDVTTFYLEDGRVREKLNSTVIGDITPNALNVSNLTFRLFQASTTKAVRVEMTVSPEASSTVPATNFYSTYVLRGSFIE